MGEHASQEREIASFIARKAGDLAIAIAAFIFLEKLFTIRGLELSRFAFSRPCAYLDALAL